MPQFVRKAAELTTGLPITSIAKSLDKKKPQPVPQTKDVKAKSYGHMGENPVANGSYPGPETNRPRKLFATRNVDTGARRPAKNNKLAQRKRKMGMTHGGIAPPLEEHPVERPGNPLPRTMPGGRPRGHNHSMTLH